VDAALQDIQSKIAQAQRNLPAQIDPPIVQKTNPEDQPIMWLSLIAKPGGRTTLLDLCRYINEHLRDDISMTPGVGSLRLAAMWTQPARLAQSRQNGRARDHGRRRPGRIASEHADVPSGYIDNGPKEFNVRVYGEAYSPEEFAKLIIPTASGRRPLPRLPVRDIAPWKTG